MIKQFDIISYLEDRGITHSESGKNVTRGWTNINCPFCEDESNHCGINLISKIFNCWICSKKGSVEYLIRKLEKENARNAKLIIREYSTEDIEFETEQRKRKYEQVLPDHYLNELPERYQNYLKSRNFNPRKVTKDYKLKACGITGEYKFRIIVPIIIDNQIVSFTARDITNKSKIPYKNCPDERSILSTQKCLGNLDQIGKTIVIVEGVFDAWRIGKGAVFNLGKKLSKGKALMLHKRGVKQALIAFDSDATDDARRDAERYLSPIIEKVEQIELLKEKDPDLLPEKDIQIIRRIIDSGR